MRTVNGAYDKENECSVKNIYNTTLIPTSNTSSSLFLDSSAVLNSGASSIFVKNNAKCSNVKTAKIQFM